MINLSGKADPAMGEKRGGDSLLFESGVTAGAASAEPAGRPCDDVVDWFIASGESKTNQSHANTQRGTGKHNSCSAC